MRWIEAVPIFDQYCDGVADVEMIGGQNFRTIYYVWQRNPMGIIERVAVAKIVRPINSIVNKAGGLASLLDKTKRLEIEQTAH